MIYVYIFLATLTLGVLVAPIPKSNNDQDSQSKEHISALVDQAEDHATLATASDSLPNFLRSLADLPHRAFEETFSQLRQEGDITKLRLFQKYWAVVDSESAFEFAKNAPWEHQDFLVDIFQEWGNENPSRALQEASNLTARLSKRRLSTIQQSYIGPSRAERLDQFSNGEESHGFISASLKGLIQSDWSSAADIATTLNEGRQRREVIAAIASELGRRDPARVADWLATLEDSESKRHGLRVLAKVKVESDPSLAPMILKELPKSLESLSLTTELVTAWGEVDSKSATGWVLENTSGSSRDEALRSLMQGIEDPEETVALLDTFDIGWPHTDLIVSEVSTWAQESPEAARQWAESLPEERRRTAIGALVMGMAETDPQQAIEYLNSLESGTDEARTALAGLLDSVGSADPKSALTLLEDFRQAADTHFDAIASAHLVSLSAQNPAAAAHWIQSNDVFATEDQRHAGRALESLMSAWATDTPEEAVSWTNTLPSGPLRDKAVAKLSKHMENGDLAFAAELASGIEDSTYRNMRLQSILDHAPQDEDLSAIVGALPITDVERAHLLRISMR